MHYFLLVAVALEVSGTMLLPVSQNFTRPLPTIGLIACYASSFYCLTFALNTLPIAVVYATWSGLGIFLITLFGYLVFDEALDCASDYWITDDRRGSGARERIRIPKIEMLRSQHGAISLFTAGAARASVEWVCWWLA